MDQKHNQKVINESFQAIYKLLSRSYSSQDYDQA